MLGPQNSALRADITDFYLTSATDFAKKQGLLVKKSKKKLILRPQSCALNADIADAIRQNEGTARNLCCVGFIAIFNKYV